MMRANSKAAHWVGRHAFPAIAATVIVVGATSAGIGYALASQSTTAATTSPVPTISGSAKPAPLSGTGARRAPGATQLARALRQTLTLIAGQIGQSVATIRSELAAGKSVNQIAGAKAPAIESEILSQITKLAGRALGAGKITSAQEGSILATAKTKVAALMAESGTQLLKDARSALQFLYGKGPKDPAPPAAAAPTPAS
jgi:hypothetical protein